MTGSTKISMEILEKESPFFMPEICEKYGWNYKTLHGYMKSYKRYKRFQSEKRDSSGKGTPGKLFRVIKKDEVQNK